MKILSDILVGFCFVAIVAAIFWPRVARRGQVAQHDFDEEAFLAAIRAVESGGRPHVVGPHGELSAYQFTAATWRQYTTVDFTWAQSPKYAEKIARSHLAWLQQKVEKGSTERVVLNLATAWRYGPNSQRGNWPISDYAMRVLRVYNQELSRNYQLQAR